MDGGKLELKENNGKKFKKNDDKVRYGMTFAKGSGQRKATYLTLSFLEANGKMGERPRASWAQLTFSW